MIAIVILAVICFVIWILNHKGSDCNGNYNTDGREDRKQVLGNMLGEFIKTYTKSEIGDLLKTREEQLEIYYLLSKEAIHLICLKYEKDDAVKISIAMNKYLFHDSNKNEIYTLHNRAAIYRIHKAINIRAFILSYFLNEARGKTTGKDMTDLLMGQRKVSPSDMSEVGNIAELLRLNVVLAATSKGIAGIIDNFSL